MEISLQNVKQKFTQWRSAKRSQKEKTPEELLKLASVCGFKYGVTVTSKNLGLNSLKLKRAMEKYAQNIEPKKIKNNLKTQSNSGMEFLEIKIPQQEFKFDNSAQPVSATLHSQPVLYELENKFGVKVRVFSESECIQKNIFSAFLFGG